MDERWFSVFGCCAADHIALALIPEMNIGQINCSHPFYRISPAPIESLPLTPKLKKERGYSSSIIIGATLRRSKRAKARPLISLKRLRLRETVQTDQGIKIELGFPK